MVQVWYMDKEETDPRLEHHRSPPKHLTLEELYGLTGVEYFKLSLDTYRTDGKLDGIRTERNYDYEDEITCSKECTPNLEEKLKSFFTEHLHTEEEIRFIIDGSGYFDVRDKNDEWIRIAVQGGDMIVIPSGIYHRFTLDTKMFITTKRYFIGKPIWLPHNRPAEEMDCRKIYLDKLDKGFSITA